MRRTNADNARVVYKDVYTPLRSDDFVHYVPHALVLRDIKCTLPYVGMREALHRLDLARRRVYDATAFCELLTPGR